MNWMSIIGLCMIVLGTVFSFFGTVFSDKRSQTELTEKIQEKNKTIEEIKAANDKLIKQNITLVQSNMDVSTTNKKLFDQNSEMLLKVGKYQKDIEDRNKKIDSLENQVSNIKEYATYAKMDLYGLDIHGGSGIIISTDLSNRMEKILLKVNDKDVGVKNDPKNLPLINEIIGLYPNFPFGYYAKAILLKSMNDNSWKAAAHKAIKILEITTSISGHSVVHDRVLKILYKELY